MENPNEDGDLSARKLKKAFEDPSLKPISSRDKTELWNRINKNISKTRKRERYLLYSRVAASFTILLLAGGLIWMLLENTRNDMANIADAAQVDENIQLILSEDTSYQIPGDEGRISYQQGGKVNIDSMDELEESKDKSGYHTLVVPYGKKTHLSLTDGTKVWVNSGSKLVYPAAFDHPERRVFVEGEAYFEVKRDDSKPFIVETKELEVKVLGTVFNLTAYPDDLKSSAVLVEGSVEVTGNRNSTFNKKKRVLTPNDRAAFYHESNDFLVKKVEVERFISWKDGYLLYKGTSLNHVMAQLERYYNKEIKLDDPALAQVKITGKLDLKQDVEKVLAIVCATSNLQFRKNGRRINIGKKNISL